jgi:hypothetical protein
MFLQLRLRISTPSLVVYKKGEEHRETLHGTECPAQAITTDDSINDPCPHQHQTICYQHGPTRKLAHAHKLSSIHLPLVEKPPGQKGEQFLPQKRPIQSSTFRGEMIIYPPANSVTRLILLASLVTDGMSSTTREVFLLARFLFISARPPMYSPRGEGIAISFFFFFFFPSMSFHGATTWRHPPLRETRWKDNVHTLRQKTVRM